MRPPFAAMISKLWSGPDHMLKLILMPFVAIFLLLRTIFFPWYLRWIFKLPAVVYVALGVWLGVLASSAYDDYLIERRAAEIQAVEGLPDRVLASQWNEAQASDGDEVNVGALYFQGLPNGLISNNGFERAFLPLADDLGREVKVVLVVAPSETAELRRLLERQGSGDQIEVAVNGTLNRNFNWRQMLDNRMAALGLPMADNYIVVEPFLKPRGQALMEGAQGSYDSMVGLGVIAALLAVLGIGKFGVGRPKRSAATQSQTSARDVQAQRSVKTASNKALPTGNGASPWDTFSPQDSNIAPKGAQMVKPQSQQDIQAARGRPLATQQGRKASKPADPVVPPLEPVFKSVFPGGGSAFRYKTADQIVLQYFGTLSMLNKVNNKNG